MKSTADTLARSYLEWIKSGISAKSLDGDVTELTTPFLDRHNDHLQIYAERLNPETFLLTDDGYIVSELKSSGVEPYGSRRSAIIRDLLSGHGVSLEQNELRIEASETNFGQRVHNLVQAMLRLDDMFVLAQPKIATIFQEDVTRFLDEHDVRYSPRVKFAGKSGLDHMVDFVIPKSKAAPERILQLVNNPRRDRIESLLFAAGDIREARGRDVAYYAFLNDSRRQAPTEVTNALSAYDIEARTWSSRENLVAALAA